MNNKKIQKLNQETQHTNKKQLELLTDQQLQDVAGGLFKVNDLTLKRGVIG
ncbi:hypothetical protein [Anabaena sp. UHCC 0399]|uniref:hypothetical protein n=1 Tax=Anabaena sp. UHCC 0399 TaxID=3110238 RepID=UPI002B20E5B6|nr:hypothetical protein [Anabaena sp. UHCC 0399]MEA5567339.1 hypothetical protein [Anabaena sp. UHCC 0399]